jgi:hypothetical protein
MMSSAKLSPAARGVPDLSEKIKRLGAFERWREIKPIDLEHVVDPALWKQYWEACEGVVHSLRQSQLLAVQVKEQIACARRRDEATLANRA